MTTYTLTIFAGGTTSIEQYEDKSFSIYPNPSKGYFTLKYDFKEDTYFKLTDVNGKLVAKYNLPASGNNLTINDDFLESGVYFYHITNTRGLNKTGKIVIMK